MSDILFASRVTNLLCLFRRASIAAVAALSLQLGFSHPVAAEPPATNTIKASESAIDYVQAVFSVQYGSKDTAGENLLSIKSDGNNYEVNFSVDHWMLRSSQTAQFKMHDCTVEPLYYQDNSKRTFKGQETQTLEFDWAKHVAVFKAKDEHKTIDLQENQTAYDPLSFFFEARCALIDGKTEFTYPVIRKGSLKEQTYRVTGKERIDTPLGSFDALIVERMRDNPKRQTRLYVAPELDFLLVKIEHQESEMLKVVATLKEMDYQLKNTSSP